MDKIAVSILGQEHKANLVNKLIARGLTTIHYDIMDGLFVKRMALQEPEMNYILAHTKPHTINLHFMVNDPLKYIKLYRDRAHVITFHYEAESIDNIKKILRKYNDDDNLGLAINPQTNVEQIYEFLPKLSHVLVMSVVPGKGGQTFIPATIHKIKKLKTYIDKLNLNCLIQVDGGINDKTGPLCLQVGAQNVVSGSFLLNHLQDKHIIKKITG